MASSCPGVVIPHFGASVNYHYSLMQGVAAVGNQNLDGSVDPEFENPVSANNAPTVVVTTG